MNKTKIIKWVTAVFFAFFMLSGAMAKFAGVQDLKDQFAEFGYPDWFFIFTGVWELCVGIMILYPKTRWIGFGLMAVTMAVAAFSNFGISNNYEAIFNLVLMSATGYLAFRVWGARNLTENN